jgi:hypothetical protein
MADCENVLGTTLANTYIGSTNQQIFDTKGRLYQNGRAIFSSNGSKASYIPEYFENILATSSNVLTPTTMTAYGVSFIATTGVATSGVGRAYLAAPIIGVEKTIVLGSTAAGWIMDVDLSTNVGCGGTTGSFIGFSTLGTRYQSITLIGVTTSMWAVKCVNSTVSGGFDAATGIRNLTAVRTS